ncbi:DUF4249 domain-containing protein [Pontibacter beigongshangensis]|uniref:DUF4249 domain-containing protein n=1 Tax=Pontibacter beigongshangensis TaxID=2574733 RepID=UPI00164F81C1|nr:DUF4249 domain-containing protein [Pontibacter beigongshangensis]
MQHHSKHIFWFLLLLLMGACEEPYMPREIVMPNRYLVVTGFINSGATTTIRLSRTQNLSDESAPDPETGANVWVEGEGGERFNLEETSPGSYVHSGYDMSSFGRCRLRIRTAGSDYASEFVTIKRTPPIDSVSWKTDEGGLNIYVNTHDPQNQTRYYRWEYDEAWEYLSVFYAELEFVDGAVRPRTPESEEIYRCYQFNTPSVIKLGNSIKLSEDRISEAQLLRIPAISNKLMSRYSILVKQYALTKEEFEYWDILKRNTESMGTLFDPLPAQLSGNIANLSDPTEIVIGYIGAYSVEEKRLFINKAALPGRWRRPSSSCLLDTIGVSEAPFYLEHGLYYPVAELVEVDKVTEYTISTRSCVDCRQYGTNVKPSYW